MRRLAIAVIAVGAFVAGTAVTAACTNSGTPAHTTAERSITARPALLPGPATTCRSATRWLRACSPMRPGPAARPAGGYADQVYAALRRQAPGLRLVKLGCSGETS